MKRTILSSLLFLYPINIAHTNNDRLLVNMTSLAMSVSLINHSHINHPDEFRRKLFGYIDQKYMIFFSLFLSYKCLRKNPKSMWELLINLSSIFYIYFYLLEGSKYDTRRMEKYTEMQKYFHVLMHFIAIIGMARIYKKYYYIK